MKQTFKRIFAVAAFVAVSAANAASVTVAASTGVLNGLTYSGSGTLSFSEDLRAALDAGAVTVASYGTATTTATQDEDGLYTEVSATAAITSLTLDSSTSAVQSALTTGGMTLTASKSSVASGGYVTVTDLNVDLTTNTVYATVIGANGVGTLTNLALFTFSSVSGATSASSAGTYVTTLTGLTITATGYSTFVTALGLLKLGQAALSSVTDYGSIVSVITATTATAAVPEPSTYLMMALGLVGLMGVSRRRAN